MITCSQAEKMVLPFINDELDDDELQEFLHHIQTCEACQEELETIFTIHMGLLQLDNKTDVEDISLALSELTDHSWVRVRVRRLADVICYAADTLCLTGVIVALAMQIFMWIH